jgi:hypothetical protein
MSPPGIEVVGDRVPLSFRRASVTDAFLSKVQRSNRIEAVRSRAPRVHRQAIAGSVVVRDTPPNTSEIESGHRERRRMKIRTKRDDQKDAKQYYHLMPPRAWRSGLEPAELSFRVPYSFHRGPGSTTSGGSNGFGGTNSTYQWDHRRECSKSYANKL